MGWGTGGWVGAGAQTGIFRGRGGFLEYGDFDKRSMYGIQKEIPAEKNMVFFLQNALKTAFSIFKKKAGETSPLPSPPSRLLCAWAGGGGGWGVISSLLFFWKLKKGTPIVFIYESYFKEKYRRKNTEIFSWGPFLSWFLDETFMKWKCWWDEMFLGQVLLFQETSPVCVPITFEVLNLKLIYVYVSE